jgi:hypothetical protein
MGNGPVLVTLQFGMATSIVLSLVLKVGWHRRRQRRLTPG